MNDGIALQTVLMVLNRLVIPVSVKYAPVVHRLFVDGEELELYPIQHGGAVGNPISQPEVCLRNQALAGNLPRVAG